MKVTAFGGVRLVNVTVKFELSGSTSLSRTLPPSDVEPPSDASKMSSFAVGASLTAVTDTTRLNTGLVAMPSLTVTGTVKSPLKSSAGVIVSAVRV